MVGVCWLGWLQSLLVTENEVWFAVGYCSWHGRVCDDEWMVQMQGLVCGVWTELWKMQVRGIFRVSVNQSSSTGLAGGY